MKRVWIGVTLLAFASVLGLGCGNSCDNARDRFAARYAECEIGIQQQPSGSEGSGDAQCTDTDGQYLDCLADCAESATCEALKGTDPMGGADFGTCNADCR